MSGKPQTPAASGVELRRSRVLYAESWLSARVHTLSSPPSDSMHNPSTFVGLRTALTLAALAALAACTELGYSDRGARLREDSLRALGARGWTDHELAAFLRSVSTVLTADSPTIERRTASRAVRHFGRSLVSSHRELGGRAKALIRDSSVEIPGSAAALLANHALEARRLSVARRFDLPYVNLVLETLAEVDSQYARALEREGRDSGVVMLIEESLERAREQVGVARELQHYLEVAERRREAAQRAADSACASAPSSCRAVRR